jgi:hypothetical protein
VAAIPAPPELLGPGFVSPIRPMPGVEIVPPPVHPEPVDDGPPRGQLFPPSAQGGHPTAPAPGTQQ